MLRTVFVALLIAVPTIALADTAAADRAALLHGIDALERPGVPGNLVVFGDDAFAVVTGGKRPEPVVAAARFGKGRVVVMAHSGYLAASTLPIESDTRGRLLRNALEWTVHGRKGARVGLIGSDPHLTAALSARGFETTNSIDVSEPLELEIVIWKNGAGDAATADAMVEFVEAGGSLITAACPWGWAQLRRRQGLTVRDDLPENHALRRMGIVYADGTTDATRDGRYALELSRPGAAHAGRALADLIAGTKGAARRAYLVERALRALPADDDAFLPIVENAIATIDADHAPRPGAPLGKGDGLARLAVTVRSLRWRDAGRDVTAFPGADAFPGAVPTDAPRVTRTVHLDPELAGWQSTGLYLAPGETLTVRPAAKPAVHARAPIGWRLRIGCHTDKLWQKDRWERWPEIAHTVRMHTGDTTAVTPWGGPVYFEALDRARPISLNVTGAVAAPHFVLGDAESEAAWKVSRFAPAPWAEIEGRNMVLSVPSAIVRELGDVKRVPSSGMRCLRATARSLQHHSRSGASASSPTCRSVSATCTRATRS